MSEITIPPPPPTRHMVTGLEAVKLLSDIRAILWRSWDENGSEQLDPDKDRTLEMLDAIADTLNDARLAPIDYAPCEDIGLIPTPPSQTMAERKESDALRATIRELLPLVNHVYPVDDVHKGAMPTCPTCALLSRAHAEAQGARKPTGAEDFARYCARLQPTTHADLAIATLAEVIQKATQIVASREVQP